MKKILSLLVKITVSALLMAFLFHKTDLAAFKAALVSLKKEYLVYAVLVVLLVQTAAVLRWSVVLGKDVTVGIGRLFSVYFVGMFFNNFLPTLVGGDVIRGLYLYKLTGRGAVSAASVIMDRYMGYASLMTVTFVALIVGRGYLISAGAPELVPAVLIVVGIFVLGSAFLWIERLHLWLVGIFKKIKLFGINEKIGAFYSAFIGFKDAKSVLLKAYLISFVVQLGVIAGIYMVALGLGISAPLWSFFLFVPLTSVVAMMPLSLAGLGFREGAFVFLFSKVGVSGAEALTMSLLWFFVTIVVSLIGAIEYVRGGYGAEIKRAGEEGAFKNN